MYKATTGVREREMDIKNCWQQKGKVEDLRDVVILHDCKLVNGASSKERERDRL